MNKLRKKACGILFCYNEEQIIGECMRYYLSQGIDLVIVDNKSSDSTIDIIEGFQKREQDYPGKIVKMLSIETKGYKWKKILRFACDYMHKKLSHYEWILLIDADAFYLSPVKDMSLLEFMDCLKKYGYNIIHGKVYEFYPTEKDKPSIASTIERMQYFRVYNHSPQHKILLYHPSVDFYTCSGHICLRNNLRVSILPFIYKHYPWISYEHGLQKIFRDRNPRFIEREEGPREHWQYLGLLPQKEDLIKESKKLQRYSKTYLITRAQLILLMGIRKLVEVMFLFRKWYSRLPSLHFDKIRLHWSDIRYIFGFSRRLAGQSLLSLVKATVLDIYELVALKVSSALGKKWGHKFFRFGSIALPEIIAQKDHLFGLPQAYHFLLTNFCNTRCLFCNQNFKQHSRKEITLQDFKTMFLHMPNVPKRKFYFSGGGEPMLCRDFFPIMRYVNETSPRTRIYIRTNGLLLGRYAQELAQRDIYQLEISIHTAQTATNNSILQIDSNHDIFENIALLNEQLRCHNSKMRKVFCVAVNRTNIDEISKLVRKAAKLKVKEVQIYFYRYSWLGTAEKTTTKLEESLFFDKQKYNDVILKTKKLAIKLRVSFIHEPLFFRKFKERPCFQPWKIMLIDWQGDVYPCTGGEVWFNKKVTSGEYNFGNLLNEHLSRCWNNDSYTMLRRTCNQRCQENFIAECRNCHNTICLKGPDIKCGHILEMNKNISESAKQEESPVPG